MNSDKEIYFVTDHADKRFNMRFKGSDFSESFMRTRILKNREVYRMTGCLPSRRQKHAYDEILDAVFVMAKNGKAWSIVTVYRPKWRLCKKSQVQVREMELAKQEPPVA